MTLHYLKSAWRVGSVGSNHFFIIANLKPVYESTILNMSEIFDFQQLLVISKKVKRLINFEVTKAIMIFAEKYRGCKIPHEVG